MMAMNELSRHCCCWQREPRLLANIRRAAAPSAHADCEASTAAQTRPEPCHPPYARTHAYHMADDSDVELQKILQGSGARLVKPGDPMPSQMPQEDPNEVRKYRHGLEEARRNMSAAERLEKAEETKQQANAHFGDAKWRVSVVGYLAGIWFLKKGSPPCPRLVASEMAGLDEVESAIGAGCALDASEPADESEAVIALRTALHLNLAQAALKLDEWAIARACCEYVLSADDANVKALFRLAKAQQGTGELQAAVNTVSKLLKREPANAEARKLLDALRKQQSREKKAFSGLFERAHAEGGGLYSKGEEERDRAAAAERSARGPGGALPEMEAAHGDGVKTLRGSDLAKMSDEERQKLVDQINEAL